MKLLTRWRDRPTDAQRVLAALAEVSETSVIPLTNATGLHGGRVHVALARLERTGEVTSRWEPYTEPRRRLYRLADEEN